MASLSLIPIMLAMGMAVDYVRLRNAQSHLQELADGAVLASAASRESTYDRLKDVAEKQYLANYSDKRTDAISIRAFEADDNAVKMTLQSSIPMMFMQLIGIRTANVSAVAAADRSIGNLEVALVLDNTWSMSEISAGVTKIAALKTAALSLVNEITKGGSDNVKIAVVPYSDYVNVGVKNRNKPWLKVADDYSVAAAPKVCVTKTTKSVCVSKTPTYACTKTVDGVVEAATCGGVCTYQTQTVAPYESCTGGGSPTLYKWYGCVGSRMTGTTRLDDGSPQVTYPGYLDTSQKCLNPIVPLTSQKAEVTAAISGMIINIGTGYKPNTYIPAGVIWGLNALSSSEPLNEAADYDPRNRAPRKVMVLMTDGENTLRFNSSDGKHSTLSTNATTAATQLKTTNNDTASICNNMKNRNIEIFSVAFMVDDAAAKSLLEGCASGTDHYFDASDAEKLLEAFQRIGQSLRLVRLTQ